MSNAVTEIPAAPAAGALTHFQSAFAFETDCADVHAAMATGAPGFVLLDVRTHELYDRGHVPGAVSLPHGAVRRGRRCRWGCPGPSWCRTPWP